jgi:hypothetical protein
VSGHEEVITVIPDVLRVYLVARDRAQVTDDMPIDTASDDVVTVDVDAAIVEEHVVVRAEA